MHRTPSALEVASVYTLLGLFIVWFIFVLRSLKLNRRVERTYNLCKKIDERFAEEELGTRKYWKQRMAGFWGDFTAKAEAKKIKDRKNERSSLLRARALTRRVQTLAFLLDLAMIFGGILGLCHMAFIHNGGIVYKTIFLFFK